MKKAAERIGQGMYAADRCVGKSNSGQMRAKQHRRARFKIAGLAAGGEQIASQQLQCLARQGVGQGVLQARRRIGFNRMDDSVDAGGGGDVGGKANREAGIEHRPVGRNRLEKSGNRSDLLDELAVDLAAWCTGCVGHR